MKTKQIQRKNMKDEQLSCEFANKLREVNKMKIPDEQKNLEKRIRKIARTLMPESFMGYDYYCPNSKRFNELLDTVLDKTRQEKIWQDEYEAAAFAKMVLYVQGSMTSVQNPRARWGIIKGKLSDDVVPCWAKYIAREDSIILAATHFENSSLRTRLSDLGIPFIFPGNLTYYGGKSIPDDKLHLAWKLEEKYRNDLPIRLVEMYKEYSKKLF
ncbi:hypothetical protein J4474_04295 [Candidatus Pacearchaeota archaeon]|nr:hypothetical protein [Candidatus Pacearchaeota archaeon]